MTIFDMPNYLWITILAMMVLTVFCTLVLKKWFSAAVITFVVLAVLAFFITFQPLLGYAAFLAIISLMISFLLWYFTRGWRRERKEKQLEKEMKKYDNDEYMYRRRDRR